MDLLRCIQNNIQQTTKRQGFPCLFFLLINKCKSTRFAKKQTVRFYKNQRINLSLSLRLSLAITSSKFSLADANALDL